MTKILEKLEIQEKVSKIIIRTWKYYLFYIFFSSHPLNTEGRGRDIYVHYKDMFLNMNVYYILNKVSENGWEKGIENGISILMCSLLFVELLENKWQMTS